MYYVMEHDDSERFWLCRSSRKDEKLWETVSAFLLHLTALIQAPCFNVGMYNTKRSELVFGIFSALFRVKNPKIMVCIKYDYDKLREDSFQQTKIILILFVQRYPTSIIER